MIIGLIHDDLVSKEFSERDRAMIKVSFDYQNHTVPEHGKGYLTEGTITVVT